MPVSKADFDVAIVGAGPAGSGAAAALAARGWTVLLLEQDHFPRHKVCGEFLSPEAQGSLQTLGLADAVAALAPAPIRRAEITAHQGQRVHVDLPGTALGVSRFALDVALADAAQERGAQLWSGVSVLGVEFADGMYTLRLRTRASASTLREQTGVSARTVILACGRHNRLALQDSADFRQRQGTSRNKKFVGIKCHVADVALPEQVELYFFRGGYGGINPVEDQRANFCMLVGYEAFQMAGKSAAGMVRAAREFQPALDERLAGGRELPETVKTVAAVDTSEPITPWLGAPCVGDAAAMITPLCGDGMAMALRGAEICVPLLDAHLRGTISVAELEQSYCRAWHDEFDRRIRIGRMLQGALQKPVVADALVGIGKLTPPLVRYLVHATRGTHTKLTDAPA